MDYVNAGYKLTRIIAETKCFTDAQTQRAIDAYADMVKCHDRKDVTYVLAQLLAQAAIESTISGN